MQTLVVPLGTRSYPIYIGTGLLAKSDLVLPHLKSRQVLVVTNETIAPLYLDRVLANLAGCDVATVILRDGERYKTIEEVNAIFDRLLANNHSRSTTLLALGGGVVGDMTGFAAACYQRGVAFIQIPTTLLAQVDSSVGGKTGVNHPLGKNMIGAFHQPACVVIDVDTLQTLPDREFRAGLAEVIKYGLIMDADFFAWIEENIDAVLSRDVAALVHAIKTSCACKAEVVAADEKESGVRAHLNLGHTFGHAIESWQSYQGFLHGEAVAVGMVMAAELSRALGFVCAEDVERIRRLLVRCSLPVCSPDGMSPDAYIGFMRRDKKAEAGRIRLVLLERIGQAMIYEQATDDMIMAAIDACCRQASVGVW